MKLNIKNYEIIVEIVYLWNNLPWMIFMIVSAFGLFDASSNYTKAICLFSFVICSFRAMANIIKHKLND